MSTDDTTPLLVDATHRLEHARSLDRYIKAIEPMARGLISDPLRRSVLHGKALGHAVHPVLTDIPLGSWASASLLDLTLGTSGRRSAKRLVGFGVLAAVPTAVTGWAEWAVADQRTKRVGIVHAGANSIALGIYGASWLARHRGHHARGAALALLGSLCVGFSGYLGSHMALGLKHATKDPAITPSSPVSSR